MTVLDKIDEKDYQKVATHDPGYGMWFIIVIKVFFYIYF